MPANKSGPVPRKKKGRRGRLVAITVVLLLVAGIGFGAFWGVSTVRASFPQTTGSLKLPGLTNPVDVTRDANGIPQVYADTDEDLFRAQGYVQAQDRFWEMDVRRHMTIGRLSEMFGKGQVKTDSFLRTLGWRHVAQKEYDTKLSPSTKKYLQSYSAGVNAYLKDHEGSAVSLEYAALDLQNDYKPEKWTPVDSVAWLKAMAWDLRGNMQEEIDRSLMTSRFTPAQIAELYPAYPYKRNKPIVDGGAVDPATKKFSPKGPASSANTTPMRRHHRPPVAAVLAVQDPRQGPGAARSQRQRHRLELLGRLRCAHHHRQAAARQRPAPGTADALALVPDGPALPYHRPQVQLRRLRLHLQPACPASSSATTRTSPGA